MRLLVVLIAILAAPFARAATPTHQGPPSVPHPRDAAWLAAVEYYEIAVTHRLGMGASTFVSEMRYRATRGGYSVSSVAALGQEKRCHATPDSVWTVHPLTRTYAVVPWDGYAQAREGGGPDDGTRFPFTFDFAMRMLAPDSTVNYLWAGCDTLVVNDEPRACEVWRFENAQTTASGSMWYDRGLGIVLKTTHVAADQGVSAEQTIPIFRFGATPAPTAFAFTPPDGYRRVASSDKLLVADSLEGETPADLTLADLDGRPVPTAGWRGRIVVLDFWATWCAPCVRTLPHLDGLARRYRDDVLVVGVSGEDAGTIGPFLAGRGFGYTFLRDPDERAHETYRVTSIPALYVLDREGVVRDHFVGATSYAALVAAVERLGARSAGD